MPDLIRSCRGIGRPLFRAITIHAFSSSVRLSRSTLTARSSDSPSCSEVGHARTGRVTNRPYLVSVVRDLDPAPPDVEHGRLRVSVVKDLGVKRVVDDPAEFIILDQPSFP